MESLRFGRLAEAVELWSRALELREQETQGAGDGSLSHELCRCLDNLGRALRQSGELEEAEAFHRRAMKLRLDHLGENHLEVAASLDFLAMVKKPDQLAEKEEILRQSLSIRRSHLPSDHPLLAESYSRLAQVDLLRNQPLEAEQKLVGVVEVRRRQLGLGQEDTHAGLSALLDFYVRAERPIAIEALAEPWLVEAREAPGSGLGESALKFARAYRALGMEVQAEPLLAEAERILTPSRSDDDPEMFDLLEHSLANALALGHLEETERLLGCLLQRERATYGPEDLRVILRLKQLSDLMGSEDRPVEAISYLEECLEATLSARRENPLGFEGPCPVQTIESLIDLEALLDRPGQVEVRLKQLLAFHDADQGPSSEASLRVLIRLDDLAQSSGDTQASLDLSSDLVDRGLRAGERGLEGPEDLIARFRRTVDSLSVQRLKADQKPESEYLHRRLIEHLEKVAPFDFSRAIDMRERLLGQLLRQGRLEDADRVLQQICERRAELLGPSHLSLAGPLEQRSDLQRTLGRPEEAIASLEQAVALRTGASADDDSAQGSEQIDRIRVNLQVLSQLYLEGRRFGEAKGVLARLASSWRMASPRSEERELECLETLSALYLDGGPLEELEATLERIRELRISAAKDDPSTLVSTLELLGAVKCILGKQEQAETLFGSLPELGGDSKAPVEISRRWVELLDQHGKLDLATRLIDAALNAYTETAVASRAKDEENPPASEIQRDSSRSTDLLVAGWLELKGDLDRSRLFDVETCYLEAIEIRKRILGDRHGEVGRGLSKLAALYADEGRFETALDLFKQALDLQRACGKTRPAALIETLSGLAEVCSDLGLAEAEDHYRAALDESEQTIGTDQVETAKVLAGLARVLREQGRSAESEPLLQRAFGIFESQLPDDHPLIATTSFSWGQVLWDLGELGSAEPLLQRALRQREQALGDSSDPSVGRIHNQLGLLELKRGRFEEAQAEFDRARSILQPLAEAQPLEWAVFLSNIAELELSRGRSGSAAELFREAANIRERSLGPKASEVALAWCRQARAHQAADEPAQAEALWRQAVEVLEDRSDRPLDTATALDQLADLLCRAGSFELAEPLYRQSLEIRETHSGLDSLEAAYSHFGLATTYRFRGLREPAQLHFCRCKEIWRGASEYGLLAEADRRWSRPFQEVSS